MSAMMGFVGLNLFWLINWLKNAAILLHLWAHSASIYIWMSW